MTLSAIHHQGAWSSSPALIDAVLSGLTYPVFALDEQSNFVFVNPAAEEFFRASRGMLLGAPLSGYLDADHQVFTMIRRVQVSRSSISDQGIELKSAKIGQRLVNIQVSMLPDTVEIGTNGVIVALQERSLAERLRGQQQFRGAARSMTSLSALLAHEIKNPLAGIRGAAELLEQGGRQNADALTQLIIAETDRIAALLTRMESLAGGKDIDRHPVNIHEVISHCIQLAQNSFGKDFTIVSDFDPSLPEAEGDRDLLIQSLLNLIKNACEASDRNNKIVIRTFFNFGARLAVSGQKSGMGSPLVIEVEDHGKGIPDDLRERIFDPFVTSKSSGSGLGLALVASTIADHGGTLDVQSQAGHTIFRVGLQVVSPKQDLAFQALQDSESRSK